MLCKIAVNVDDIKLWASRRTTVECMLSQKDLDIEQIRPVEDNIPFDLTKYKMPNVRDRVDFIHQSGLNQLVSSVQRRELSVIISSSLCTSAH